MRPLIASSVGFYRTRPVTWLTTLGGIGLGVAAVVAIDIATQSAATAMRLSVDELYGNSTHQIGGGPDGISPEAYARLRREYPAVAFAPVIEGRARLGDERVGVLGLDLLSEARVRSRLVTAGPGDGTGVLPVDRFMTVADSVAVSRQDARRWSLTAGDTATLATGAATFTVRIVAVLDRAPSGVVLTDLANADVWFGRNGTLSRIDVNAEGYDDAVDRIQASLPSALFLVPTQARADATVGMTRAFNINLTAMSLLALLIGGFLIFNALSFAVVQRREQFAALRAFGVERSQVLLLVLGEALTFGLLGTLGGTAIGIVLGGELTALVARTVNDLYFRVAVTDVTVTTAILGKAIVLGIVFTGLAALPAALEAAGTRPGLALRRSTLEQRSIALQRSLVPVGIGLGVLGVGVVAVSGGSLVAGLAALFLVIIAYAFVLPAAVVGVLDRVLVPLAERCGRLASLTVGGVSASLSRTGVAIVALTVAISATIGVSTMVSSFRESVVQWLEGSLSADIYVSAADGAITDELRARLAALPGVRATGATRRVWLPTEGAPLRLQAIDTVEESGDQQLIEGDPETLWPAFQGGDGVIVSEIHAYRSGLGVGDSIRLPTTATALSLPVLGIYRSYDVTGGAVLLALARYRELWDDRALDALAVALDAGADRGVTRRSIDTAVDGIGQPFVIDAGELRTRSMAVFDRTFVITDVLYLIAVGIAVVGIVGALLALQFEQRVVLATYRALGMTRRATALVVLAQSAVIGLLAGIAALPLGIGMARLLIDVVNRRAFGWTMGFELDPLVLGNAIAGALVAALIGGALPAWRAGRTAPALALRGSL